MSTLLESLGRRLSNKEQLQTATILPATAQDRLALEARCNSIAAKPSSLLTGGDLFLFTSALLRLVGGIRYDSNDGITKEVSHPLFDQGNATNLRLQRTIIPAGIDKGEYLEIQTNGDYISQRLTYGLSSSRCRMNREEGPFLYSKIFVANNIRLNALLFDSYISGNLEPVFPDGYAQHEQYLSPDELQHIINRILAVYKYDRNADDIGSNHDA